MATKRKRPAQPRPNPLSAVEDILRQYTLHSGVTDEAVRSIREFQGLSGDAKLHESRNIIIDTIIEARKVPDERFSLAVDESQSLLSGYATLDGPHRAQIRKLIEQISSYLRDQTRKRPLNALMLASPGAGKSHFIRQLAAKMREDHVQAVTFNMATMQSPDDMAKPVDELRNLKVNDRFPLLFLDEFDSDPARYPSLLPLLWDGELQIGHRDLKLGKAVIVLAGSSPDLPKAMDHSATMRLDGDVSAPFVPTGKLVDLLSRINGGVIEIPDLDLRTENRDRRIDKVCVAVALIKGRFGAQLNQIPRALLRFIAHTTFRYGVRSIAHLIEDFISSKAVVDGLLKVSHSDLPMASEDKLVESSLKLHLLDKDQGFGIVNRWKEFSRDRSTVILRPPSAILWQTPEIFFDRHSAATKRSTKQGNTK